MRTDAVALRNEISSFDLFVLNALKVRYPGVYALIRDNRGALLYALEDEKALEKHISRALHDEGEPAPSKETIQAIFKEEMESSGKKDRGIVMGLLVALLPNTAALWGDEISESVSDILEYHRLERPRRLANPDYFNRYFSYGVPASDVPDSAADEVLDLAGAGPGGVGRLEQKIADIMSRSLRAPELLLDKLEARLRRHPIPQAQAGLLARISHQWCGQPFARCAPVQRYDPMRRA